MSFAIVVGLTAVFILSGHCCHGCDLHEVNHCVNPLLKLSKSPDQVCRAIPGISSCLDTLISADNECSAIAGPNIDMITQIKTRCVSTYKDEYRSGCTKDVLSTCSLVTELTTIQKDAQLMCRATNASTSCLEELKGNLCNQSGKVFKDVLENALIEQIQSSISICEESITNKALSNCTSRNISQCLNKVRAMHLESSNQESYCESLNAGMNCLNELNVTCGDVVMDEVGNIMNMMIRNISRCQNREKIPNNRTSASTNTQNVSTSFPATESTCRIETVAMCFQPLKQITSHSMAEMCTLAHQAKSCLHSMLSRCGDSLRSHIDEGLKQMQNAIQMCPTHSSGINSPSMSSCSEVKLNNCFQQLQRVSSEDITTMCPKLYQVTSCLEPLLINCQEVSLRSQIEYTLNQIQNLASTCPGNSSDSDSKVHQCSVMGIQTCLIGKTQSPLNQEKFCANVNKMKSCLQEGMGNCSGKILESFQEALVQVEDGESQCENIENASIDGKHESTNTRSVSNSNLTNKPSCSTEQMMQCLQPLQQMSSNGLTAVCPIMNKAKSCFEALFTNCQEVSFKSQIEQTLNQLKKTMGPMCPALISNNSGTSNITCSIDKMTKCAQPLQQEDFNITDPTLMCSTYKKAMSCLESLLINCPAVSMRFQIENIINVINTTIKECFGRSSDEKDLVCSFIGIQACLIDETYSPSNKKKFCANVNQIKSCLQEGMKNCSGKILESFQEALAQVEDGESQCENIENASIDGKHESTNTRSVSNSNLTNKPSCSTEQMMQCLQPLQQMSSNGLTAVCPIMNKAKSCLESLFTNCQEVSFKSQIEQTLNQLKKTMGPMCPALISNNSGISNITCSIDKMAKCAQPLQQVDFNITDPTLMCSTYKKAKFCLETLLINCPAVSMRSQIQNILNAINTTITMCFGRSSDEKDLVCSFIGIQACLIDETYSPSNKKKFCANVNKIKSCLQERMRNCSGKILESFQESLVQVEDGESQCKNIENASIDGKHESTNTPSVSNANVTNKPT